MNLPVDTLAVLTLGPLKPNDYVRIEHSIVRILEGHTQNGSRCNANIGNNRLNPT